MNDLMFLLRALLCMLPFFGLCSWLRGINLPRTRRAWQYLTIPLAAVYGLVCMFRLDELANTILSFFDWLTRTLSRVPIIGSFLSSILSQLNLGLGVQLLVNTMLLLGFCLVKKLLLKPLSRAYKMFPDLYAWLILNFYEQEPGDRHPYLQEGCQQLRRILHVFYYAFLALAGMDMFLCLRDSGSRLYQYPLYPVFGLILMGEVLFFMDAPTRREADDPDAGDHAEERPDFALIRTGLEETFGDHLLYGDDHKGVPRSENKDQWLEDQNTSDDNLERITGAYYRHLEGSGEAVEMDYAKASQKLLRGQSVLMCNPFYRDLTPYLMLPMLHRLLNHRRILVVSGRRANDDDVKAWLEEGVLQTTNLEHLWKVEFLKGEVSPRYERLPDIGILSFNDLYNLKLQQAYREFFAEADFVLILEPSNLLGTGQIGLRSICQQCEAPDKQITYCACDRNCDGLVDALSHTLRQSILQVTASPVPRATHYQMFWAAEGPGVAPRILPKMSHYLGFGSELSAFAMKHHVKKVFWYSGSKMPLGDLRWAVGQYYRTLCGYVGIPAEQSALDERFHFVDGLWQADRHEDAFILVEDEFCNMFEMARAFTPRLQRSGFVNVLSENYLLRDYMRRNADLMENDPKAIPTLCPDFARTQRNLVLRMLMLMAVTPQEETTLHRELTLHGCRDGGVYETLCELITTHTGLPAGVVQVVYRDIPDPVGSGTISRKFYAVSSKDFYRLYAAVLSPACFVVENEQEDRYYMGARMMGQVCQTLLPGQFFCYDGKYYQVQSIPRDGGIVVRRAADHLTGRQCYRQLRTYSINGIAEAGPTRDLRGLQVTPVTADIQVFTEGYLVADARNELTCARKVDLANQVEPRRHTHKQMIRIRFPDAPDKVLFTLCALLNELFVTLYPNEEGFLVAATNAAAPADDLQRAVVPQLSCDEEEPALYLIEDCFMDLGLAVSAERSLQRILEIITDYLDWYLDPGRVRWENEDKTFVPPAGGGNEGENGENGGNGENSSTAAAPEAEAEENRAEHTTLHAEAAAPIVQGAAVPGQDVTGDDEELVSGLKARDPIHEYLTYGGDKDADWLDLAGTLEYLTGCRFDESALQRTRKGDPEMEEYLRHLEGGTHICDFCGAPMTDGKFDALKDGRERCPECSATAVRKVKDARVLFHDTLEQMERVFGIQIRTPINVRVVSAKKIAKEFGEDFKATKGFDPRVLGFARNWRDGRRYDLYLENGAPREALESTIVHELTHIWQYEHWDREEIDKKYGQMSLHVIEGMAVWSEIQYLLCTGRTERAKRYEVSRLRSHDEYGDGLRLYEKRYRFHNGSSVSPSSTPYGNNPPL